MKMLLATLLIAAAFSAEALAAPSLQVDIDLVEHSAAGDRTLMHPLVITSSGKRATIQSGKFEYRVTPVLLDNGTVDVSTILIERDGKNAHQIVDQRIKAKLGHSTEVRVDNLVFRTTTSVMK